MKIILGIIVIGLTACATIDKNAFYHGMPIKPNTTEEIISNGQKKIVVHNPLNTSITMFIDCDEEAYAKVFNLKPNSDKEFSIASNIPAQSCVIENWAVK